MTLLAVEILIAAGVCDVEPCEYAEVLEKAEWLVQACESDAALAPVGGECVLVLASLWGHESANTFLAWSTGRWTGTGGPLQVVGRHWHNSRIGHVYLPPHELLGGEEALRWGVWALRLKWAKARTLRGRIEAFNGSSGKVRYADAVLRTLRRLAAR